MAKLKIGEQIKTKEDARNLIINLIESSDEFAQSFIVKLAINYMSGSPLRYTDKKIADLVEEIVYEYMIENKIYCDYGIFYKVKTEEKTM